MAKKENAKRCAICYQVPEDMIHSYYCFSCDRLYCPSCVLRNVKKYETEWVCPKCGEHVPLTESQLFKEE